LVAVLALGLVAAAGREPMAVEVALSASLFGGEKDEDALLKKMQPFADSIKQRTQVQGHFRVLRGTAALAKAFQDRKIQMAVVPGHEYGWLRAQIPQITPVVVAVQEKVALRAYVVVPQGNAAQSVADLKGQPLALAPRTPPHARFYLEQLAGQPLEQFFKEVPARSTDAALDAVVDKQATVTAVGETGLAAFKDNKPGRYNRLRTLAESPPFPATVFVYDPRGADPQVLAKFRDSLLGANQTVEGRQTLTLWQLTAFQAVPADYEKLVSDIVKAYPPPKG
jgi:ABC-type phosphate/phosphonate transport system substrate-binding protein